MPTDRERRLVHSWQSLVPGAAMPLHAQSQQKTSMHHVHTQGRGTGHNSAADALSCRPRQTSSPTRAVPATCSHSGFVRGAWRGQSFLSLSDRIRLGRESTSKIGQHAQFHLKVFGISTNTTTKLTGQVPRAIPLMDRVHDRLQLVLVAGTPRSSRMFSESALNGRDLLSKGDVLERAELLLDRPPIFLASHSKVWVFSPLHPSSSPKVVPFFCSRVTLECWRTHWDGGPPW